MDVYPKVLCKLIINTRCLHTNYYKVYAHKPGTDLKMWLFSEKRCPKCDFLTQRDGWMYGKPNFDDIHPRAGLVKINEESAKCHLYRICGFKCHLNCDHE